MASYLLPNNVRNACIAYQRQARIFNNYISKYLQIHARWTCTHTKVSLAFWGTFYTWNLAQITQYVLLDTLYPDIPRKKYWFSKCNILDQRRSPGRNTYGQMPISDFFEIVDYLNNFCPQYLYHISRKKGAVSVISLSLVN